MLLPSVLLFIVATPVNSSTSCCCKEQRSHAFSMVLLNNIRMCSSYVHMCVRVLVLVHRNILFENVFVIYVINISELVATFENASILVGGKFKWISEISNRFYFYVVSSSNRCNNIEVRHFFKPTKLKSKTELNNTAFFVSQTFLLMQPLNLFS